MDKQQVIRETLAEFYQPAPPYPGQLPSELADWHCYTSDGGHSILVCIWPANSPEAPIKLLCPAPPRAVLRHGWTAVGEFIFSPIPYNPDFGLVCEPEDDEF